MAIEQGMYRIYVRYKESTATDWEWYDDIYTYVKVNNERKSGVVHDLINRPLVYDQTEINYCRTNLGLAAVPTWFANKVISWSANIEQVTSGFQVFSEANAEVGYSIGYSEIKDCSGKTLIGEASFYSDFRTLIYRGSFSASGGTGSSPPNIRTNIRSGMVVTEGYMPLFEYVSGTDTLYLLMYDPYIYSSRQYCDGTVSAGTVASQEMRSALEELDPYVPKTDPYAPGGTSGVAGGGGTFDFTGDTIADDPLPSLSAVDTGFITLFKPTVAELNGLAGFMWNDLDVNNFTRIFNDIMDVILGLSLVPLSPSQIPSAGRRSVTLGNIVATDITCEACSDQWVRVPAGELTLQETFAGYLDYDPFTEAQIYLPFIGYRSLRVDDIMDHNLTLSYDFDILSGGCVAKLFVDGSIMYQFIGEAAVSIPITGGDWTNVVNGMLQIATAIGATVATQGAALPFVAGQAINGATQISKPEVERSGGMGGSGGLLSKKSPYIILTRPNQCLPEDQNRFTGYPSLITETLGDLSGYTEIEMEHISGLGAATSAEMLEIQNLLREGVIF